MAVLDTRNKGNMMTQANIVALLKQHGHPVNGVQADGVLTEEVLCLPGGGVKVVNVLVTPANIWEWLGY